MVRRMLPAQTNHNALPAAVQRFVILRSDSQHDTSLPTLTRKSEAVDPDEIAVRLIERVRDLTAFLESQDLEAQRKALFAFCKRIVADAKTREIVIETDLTGMAQSQAVPGLPAELCNLDLPE